MKSLDAYFAGLLDGEGYIAIAKKDAKYYRQKISMKMTCKQTVDAIHAHFGVGAVRFVPRQNPKWKDQWEWYCTYDNARMVAERILPFSITKRIDIQRLLEHKSIKRGGSDNA